MESSEQRRKRKHFRKPTSCFTTMILFLHHFASNSKLVSLRSLFFLFFSILTFVYIVSLVIHVKSSADFKPVLVVSTFSLRTIQAIQDVSDSSLFLKIEDSVFLPDHVLLFVSDVKTNGWLLKVEKLECLYGKSEFDIQKVETFENGILRRSVLSIDEYDDARTIVRCPLPPVNYSNVVSLKRGLGKVVDIRGENLAWERNYNVNSCNNLAYAATLDGNTVVVFVKGLNLRPDRESDPSQFSCHFGIGNMESDGRSFMFTTRAITAAQEVVRCLLPQMIGKNTEMAQGILVTIGMIPHVHALAHEQVVMPSVEKIFNPSVDGRKRGMRKYERVVMPSVAKIFNPSADGRERGKEKYELCVCTMLRNQASALREWITYHSWLGVERWFIYDNNSDDGIQEAVKELDSEGFNVSRHVWPWVKTQEAGFSHCALRAKHECTWVSFMDVDEYYHFPYTTPRHHVYRSYSGQNALHYLVANVTASSERIAEIRTDCHSFGPSGLDSAPPQGVTVGYTCRLQSPERHKSIIRPVALHATLLNVVHHFHLRKGFKYLNLPQSTATINHYKYQVWDVFKTKFYRRVATYVVDWHENQNEGSRDRAPGLGTEAIEPPNWSIRFCEIWDTGLRDIVLSNLADDSTGLLPWERHSL